MYLNNMEGELVELNRPGNCMVKVLSTAVQHYLDRKYLDYELFFAGEGMLFSYGSKKMKGRDVPHFLGFGGKGFFQRASDKLSLDGHVVPHMDDCAIAEEYFIECVRHHYMGCFVIDDRFLPYEINLLQSQIAQPNTHYYNAIPIGYDTISNEVELYIPTIFTPFKTKMDKSTFIKTWFNTMKAVPGSSFVWTGMNGSFVSMEDFYVECIRHVGKTLSGEDNLSGRCFGWFSPRSFGVNAVREMANEVSSWATVIEEDRRSEFFKNMILFKSDSGYVSYQVGDLLEGAAKITGMKEFSAAAIIMWNIASEWEIISNLLYKAGFMADPKSILTRVAERLKRMSDNLSMVSRTILES